MARPSCIKCGHGTFEITTIAPRDSKFRISLVHCASCGTPVGVLPYINQELIISEIHDMVKQILDAQG